MMIPKRRLLTLIFACLCFKKSLLMKMNRRVEKKKKAKRIACLCELMTGQEDLQQTIT